MPMPTALLEEDRFLAARGALESGANYCFVVVVVVPTLLSRGAKETHIPEPTPPDLNSILQLTSYVSLGKFLNLFASFSYP